MPRARARAPLAAGPMRRAPGSAAGTAAAAAGAFDEPYPGYCASSTSTQSGQPVLLLPGVASCGVLPVAANGDPGTAWNAPLVGSYQRARTVPVLKPPRLTCTL